MGTAVRFKDIKTPRQQGEFARLKVTQGPDAGAVFVIFGAQTLIGRGEEADVMIRDLKASRVHAELLGSQGGWAVRDKGSANGILHNGKQVREAVLQVHDNIGIGETLFEFLPSDLGTIVLTAPPQFPPRTAVNTSAQEERLSKRKKNLSGESGKNKNVLLILGVLVIGYLFLPDPPKKKPLDFTPPKDKANASANTVDLASYLPKTQKNKTATSLFKDGLREYFDGNYNRAKTQFETVLQISPDHVLAKIYLENSDNAIKEQVTTHLEFGKKSFESGKLKEAKAHFERVMLLLFKDQSNASYTEAKDQFEKINKKVNEDDST